MDNKRIAKTDRGFSLVEVLVTAGIIATVTIILLRLFVYCTTLSQMAGDLSYVVTEAQDKLEEIKNYNYDLITIDYGSGGTPGNVFTLSSSSGKGNIYIDSSNPNLLEVEIDVSWRSKDGRVIGQDTDLDGILDMGEDTDGNGKLDSIVKLVTKIAKR